jgi:AraC-like DNA-binding protein
VEVEPIFRQGGFMVSRWRCRVRDVGATAMLCHQWHVMKFVHTGAFKAHLPDGTVFLDSTRTLLAAPQEPFMVTRQFGPAVTGTAIGVSQKLMAQIVEEHDGDISLSARLLRAELTPRALLAQHLILRQIEENAPPMAIEELGVTLIAESFRDPSMVPQQKRRRNLSRDAVEMAQAILAANYEKALRLDDIARAVEISPYHLCRAFKRVTGVPMHQYLNRLRVRAALSQLAEPGVALAEIAHEHGFASHSHFAAAFRKEFLVTPSQVRRLATLRASEVRNLLGLELSRK